MEIGFCGRHFDVANGEELCKLAAKAGFAAISLSGAQIKGLNAEQCRCFAIREVCWKPEEGHPLMETARAAEKLGAQVLVLPMQAVETEELGAILKETNLKIAFENSGAGESLAEIVDKWNQVQDTNRFFACLNTGCAIVSGKKPERIAAGLGDRLISVHVNDNHGKRDSYLLPYRGRSAMDWTAFLRKLAEIEFDGMLWMDVRGLQACQATRIAEDWICGQFAMACYLQQTVEDYRSPERRPTTLRRWLQEELRAGVLGITADVTYLHLSERPSQAGFLPEADGSGAMHSASASIYALLMLENEQTEKARTVLSYILEIVKERQLSGIPASVGENRNVLEEPMSVETDAKMVLAFARTCLQEENVSFEEPYFALCCKQIRICMDAVETLQNKGNVDFSAISFLGAAVEAMCQLAQRREDFAVAEDLESFAAKLSAAAEKLLPVQTDWRLLAPLASGWNGIDWLRLENAICIMETKTRIYDEDADIRISMSGYDTKNGVQIRQYAFVIGWMIEHARLRKNVEAIGEWVRFFKQYQKRDYLLVESFWHQDGKWCFGNRSSVETSAWFCMMVYRLRRELQQEGSL